MQNKKGGKSTNLTSKKSKSKKCELSEEDIAFKNKLREDKKKIKEAVKKIK